MRTMIFTGALAMAAAATAQSATSNLPKAGTDQPTAQSRAAATTPPSAQGKSLGGTASMHQLKADEHARAAMASTGLARARHHRAAAAELRKAADLHTRAAATAEAAMKGRR